MNYNDMHEADLVRRWTKPQKQANNRLSLADLGKVAPDHIRTGAFKHFCNMLETLKKQGDAQSVSLRIKIRKLSTSWNFDLPDWF